MKLIYFSFVNSCKEGIVEEKNPKLEYYYTKKAAELGIVEAMHNLGCIYIEGIITDYNSLKAISWFTHAGAFGLDYSLINVANIFIDGGRDGRVKRNYHAALSNLNKIPKDGKIKVDRLIKYCIKKIEEKNENYN